MRLLKFALVGKAFVFVQWTLCKIFFAHTDIIVCVEYLLQGHSAWGCFAMGFTILPACVTQLFSLRWHHSDGSLRTVHWLLHFLLLGFLHRYLIFMFLHNLFSQIVNEFCKYNYLSISQLFHPFIYLFSGTWRCFTPQCTLWGISRASAKTRIGCIDKKAIFVCCICLNHLWELRHSWYYSCTLLQHYIMLHFGRVSIITFFDVFKYYFILILLYIMYIWQTYIYIYLTFWLHLL